MGANNTGTNNTAANAADSTGPDDTASLPDDAAANARAEAPRTRSTPTRSAELHPELRKVRVRIVLSGAASAGIFLNGQPIGVSAPQTIELDPGNYRVGVGRGGSVERTRTLRVRPGQAPRTLRFELE